MRGQVPSTNLLLAEPAYHRSLCNITCFLEHPRKRSIAKQDGFPSQWIRKLKSLIRTLIENTRMKKF